MKVIFANLKDLYIEQSCKIDMLGILSLATVVRQTTTYQVEVIDFQHEFVTNGYVPREDFEEEVAQQVSYIMDREPQVVSFYTMCSNYHIVIDVAKKIKQKNPSIKILLGGPQATLTAEETLRQVAWIDAIGIGEGEKSIVPILDAVINNADMGGIRGVVYRKDDQVIHTGMPELIADLDTLPIIDYSFVRLEQAQVVDIDAGRGCPFGCTFCSTKSFWGRRFRLKSAERIVQEIELLSSEHGIRHFSLTHDLFTANKQKVMAFCQLLIEKKLDIFWGCSSRADTLDEEMIEIMVKAGCHKIFLGIETGSQRMQKLVNKNLNIGKVENTIMLLKKYKCEFILSFIYAFPNETLEDINETLGMIYNLCKKGLVTFNQIQLHELSFFPGTELLEKYGHELSFATEFNATMLHQSLLPDYLSEFIRNNKAIFPHFFSRTSSITEATQYLDRYVSFVYLRTFNKFSRTWELLLEHYEGDHLKLFTAYRCAELKALEGIFFYHKEAIRKIIGDVIGSVKRFIDTTDFGSGDFLIKQVAQFEYDITEFLFFSEQEYKEIQYAIDVYEIVKNKKRDEETGLTVVQFQRTSPGNISVNRIKSCKKG